MDICWTTTGIVATGRVEYKIEGTDTQRSTSKAEGCNHRVQLRGLNPGATYTGRILTTWQGEEITSDPFTFRAFPKGPPESKPLTIDLTVPEPTGAPRRNWPATVGMPFPRGTLARVDDLALRDRHGARVPLQATATSHWDDGSVKWATLSFLADSHPADQPGGYQLMTFPGGAGGHAYTKPVLSLVRTPEAWEVDIAMMSFAVPRGASDRLMEAMVLETGDGRTWTCAPPVDLEIEENGSVRAVLRASGKMCNADGEDDGWRYLARLTFWRDMPGVAVNVSVWNGAESPLFRKVRRLSIRMLRDDGESGLRGSLQGEPLTELAAGQSMRLFQDTDAHYAQSRGSDVKEGERALGLATMSRGEGAVSILVRDFWQTYPSALELSEEGLRADLLPALAPDAYTAERDGAWFYCLYPWFDDGCYLMRAGQTTQHEFYYWLDTDDREETAKRQAAWFAQPLMPQASPEYLCSAGVLGAALFPKTPGVWDAYESSFEAGFEALMQARESNRMYGWMNYGDWYGERGYNAGNNEYDLAWCLGMQWVRTGDPRFFERGLQMARHYATVDTIRGEWTDNLPGVVWEHSFNHVGTRRSPEALGFDEGARKYAKSQVGTFLGGMDPQGHIFEDGVWLYGLLTGDAFLLETAERVCTRQAEFLTPAFDFEIERGGGWPLINATGAYMFTGNPYYLNAARIMVQRCLERHDPEHGGWPHVPPINETLGVPVMGGKAFATGILTFGLLRYLDVEPIERPNVSRMLINTADWLMNESWEPGNGFKYITNSPKHVGQGHRGHECLMNADIIGYAYETTRDPKYLTFWEEMMAGAFDGPLTGWGKGFSQGTRQTVFGLARARNAGIVSCRSLDGQ